jgi:hypothetical protein
MKQIKTYIAFLLVGLILGVSLPVVAADLRIIPNSFPVLINNVITPIDGYNINGYTYLRLADFKKLGLNVTFNVTKKQIEITAVKENATMPTTDNQLTTTDTTTIITPGTEVTLPSKQLPPQDNFNINLTGKDVEDTKK